MEIKYNLFFYFILTKRDKFNISYNVNRHNFLNKLTNE